MNILDKYIFKGVLFTCITAVAVFAFVLMLGNIVRDLLGLVLTGQLGATTFVQLTLLLIPFVVSYALPMGILTGVLLSLGRLSADSEITAMRASGLSLSRIARPVLILGALGAAGGLYINFNSMPWARVEYDREWHTVMRTNPLSFLVPKTFIRNFPGYVAYIGDKQGSRLSDFWLWQIDDQQRVVQAYHADSGRLDYDEEANALVLTLAKAKVQTFAKNNPEDFSEHPPVATLEKSDPIPLSLNRIFGPIGGRRKPLWMTYGQLTAARMRINDAESGRTALSSADAALVEPPYGAKQLAHASMRLTFAIQDKINTAFAVLSFAFIGVPLGIKVSRRETSANLGVAVALALGYYFLTVMLSWLDEHPEYRPDLLVWLPNLIFIGLGAWLFKRLDRPSTQ